MAKHDKNRLLMNTEHVKLHSLSCRISGFVPVGGFRLRVVRTAMPPQEESN